MGDINDLEAFDFECFPTLKSALALDNCTLEDVIKTRPREVFYYDQNQDGWLEQVLYANMAITVLLHSKLPYFSWEDVEKWTFHHAKKISKDEIIEPYFEVWTR
uniref:hypothetical protein n=1 Tax=Lactobacillus acidophilus TaxID=1579 RepID=UPI003F572F31